MCWSNFNCSRLGARAVNDDGATTAADVVDPLEHPEEEEAEEEAEGARGTEQKVEGGRKVDDASWGAGTSNAETGVKVLMVAPVSWRKICNSIGEPKNIA